jgi:RimJ/RimL family protein N-acetyltransferase
VEAVAGIRRQFRGKRVYLRFVEPEDLPLIQSWFEDGETASLMGGISGSLASRQARFEARPVGSGPSDGYQFLICRISDDLPVGRVDLFEIDRYSGSAALGITIGRRDLWGAGHGSDALAPLLDFAFGLLRLERVWLDTATDNVRAQRAYEKAGFRPEGVLRHAFFQDGRYGDLAIMSILRDEWEALARPRMWDLVGSEAD